MRSENSFRTKQFNVVILVLIILPGFFPLTSCMMAMHKLGRSSGSEMAKPERSNELAVIDKLIFNAISDLSSNHKLEIKSIAVWKIESLSLSIDVKNVQQKIITSLVNNTSFKVISRKNLDELLSEQSLSLSGISDNSNAVRVGELIGVEGFVKGYISHLKDHIELNMSLIKTSSGEIVWSTQQQEKINF